MNDLKDTVWMMESEDYKERFRAEYAQLSIRLKKLTAMLENFSAGALPFSPSCSYDLLHTQKIFMEGYLSALRQRAIIEDILLMNISSDG